MTVPAQRKIMFSTLLAAVIGIPFSMQDGCAPFQVRDPATGVVRDATPEEIQKAVTDAGQPLMTVPTVTGHIEWLPFIDFGIRAAALTLAWLQSAAIKRKEELLKPVPST